MKTFLEQLALQRWDDHRYYHHSRINQALHLFSALCFVLAYGLLFTDPALAALVGWLLSMCSRQAGHFFFEPKGYDEINQATHEYKERIKVGYNLNRKVVLMLTWAASPLLLVLDPTGLGLFTPASDWMGFMRNVGWMWLGVAVAGLLLRFVQLALTRSPMTGLVWVVKILTDPFSDIRQYYKAPWHLLKGEWMEPAHGSRSAVR